jgi:hypothetical protein
MPGYSHAQKDALSDHSHRHLAVLGALASLLAIAYGPFVQAIFLISINLVPTTDLALVSFTTKYPYTDQGNSSGKIPIMAQASNNSNSLIGIDRAMIFHVGSAIKDENIDWMAPPHYCVTGNCVWDEYYTLGICSRCTDIRDKLQKNCAADASRDEGLSQPGCDIALPNGFSLGGVNNSRKNVLAISTRQLPMVYGSFEKPLAVIQSILGYDFKTYPNITEEFESRDFYSYTISQDSLLAAHECVLVPCVQLQIFDVSKTPQDSKASGMIADSQPLTMTINLEEMTNYTISSNGDVNLPFDASVLPHEIGKHYRIGENFFTITNTTYELTRKYLAELLNGYIAYDKEINNHIAVFNDQLSLIPRDEVDTSLTQIWVNSLKARWNYFLCPYETPTGGIDCAIHNMAHGMSNAIRQAGWETTVNRGAMAGTSFKSVQWCRASYAWLSAPIAIWLLSSLLFVGTIRKTKKAQLKTWRTSPLAMLLLSLDSEGIAHLRDWQHLGDDGLREVATKLRLRLLIGDSGPRFVAPEDVTNTEYATKSKV